MRFRKLMLIAALVAPTASVATHAFADENQHQQREEKNEKTVKLSDIPAPARQALTREAKGSPIQRVEQEQQHGQTVYEGVIKQGNEQVGITVDAQGKVLGRHSETGEHSQQRSQQKNQPTEKNQNEQPQK